ncbi:divalent-cation tolerance protein CutA [Acrocarpospora macrocephala]|uniref:Divalent cation tolerance protein n=1 Tax=Acrocarpospora macrocephala TaxID=150177 RepID=A0A5M3WH77_9ACTN|nr:divalent-cation tolerance protein CutA [Acrocarpospora macrocephala]GES07650.1 divalent cation tolerance protein [Acrocarpospora macrocephala]
MVEYVQVQTSVDSEEAGARLAQGIVEARLAACVQIGGPIRSCYWWQGAMEASTEWQLFIKTVAGRVPDLIEYIETNHDYDTPEVIATPIIAGNSAYLRWIADEVEARDARPIRRPADPHHSE